MTAIEFSQEEAYNNIDTTATFFSYPRGRLNILIYIAGWCYCTYLWCLNLVRIDSISIFIEFHWIIQISLFFKYGIRISDEMLMFWEHQISFDGNAESEQEMNRKPILYIFVNYYQNNYVYKLYIFHLSLPHWCSDGMYKYL